jgi:hypothetical protein
MSERHLFWLCLVLMLCALLLAFLPVGAPEPGYGPAKAPAGTQAP